MSLTVGGTNAGCHGNTKGLAAHQKHIITGPNIVLVLWDDFFVNTAGASDQARQFAQDLVTGPFMNGLVQYGINRGSVVATVSLSSTTFKPSKSTWDTGGSDDGDQLVSWLKNNQITTHPSVNETKLLYVIYLPRTLGLTNGKNQDGTPNTNVCGWHGHRKFNSASTADDLFWCVLRTDGADTSSAQTLVGSVAFCASHEITEAMTNRDSQGWHGDDENGCEAGDLCEQNATFSYRKKPELDSVECGAVLVQLGQCLRQRGSGRQPACFSQGYQFRCSSSAQPVGDARDKPVIHGFEVGLIERFLDKAIAVECNVSRAAA